MVWNSRVQTRRSMGRSCWKYEDQFCGKRTFIFRTSSALEKGELKSKRKGMKTIHFNGSDDPLSWFFAQLFPSICSVSTEPETQKVRRNQPRMRILKQRLYRQNFLLPPLILRLMPKYKETCCVNTSRYSQIFLKKRNWPNSAPMLCLEEYWERTILHYTWWWYTWDHDRILISWQKLVLGFVSWMESTNT